MITTNTFLLINAVLYPAIADFIHVKSNYGDIKGYVFEVQHNQTLKVFLGIPYAKKPIGNKRFSAPEDIERWTPATFNATKFGPACPQKLATIRKSFSSSYNKTDEDCLYLNIYAPEWKNDTVANRTRAVMLWFHGGAYRFGSGEEYDGRALAMHGDVIVVTINYRLGILGFLSSDDDIAPGNYGLLDQIQAMKWVKHNIQVFGGDPDRVTIFGESAGGGSVGLHLFSNLSRGSPDDLCLGPTSRWSRDSCNTRGDDATREFFPVPMMTGTTRNEDAGAASGIPNVEKGFNKSYYDSLVYGWSRRFGNYSNVVENAIKCEYPPSDDPTKNRESFIAFKSHYGYTSPHQIYAKVHTDKQPNVWMYLFDYVGKNDPEPKWKGAYHGIEMMYMFGAPFWESIPCPYTEDRCLSNWGKKQEWNDEDRRISLLTMRFWSNMAKYSDPRDGDTKWDRFDKTKERYLEITSKMSIKEHYLPEKMKFWKDTMPKMLRGEMKVHPRCAAASDTNTLIVSSFCFL